MTILELLARDNYLMTNINIAKALGLNEAVLIGELARKWNYWAMNNGLTEDGFFFITQQEIEADTTLSPYQQTVTFRKLQDKGIIEIERKGGTQRTNYYRINELELAKFLNFHTLKTSSSISKKLEYGNSKNSDLITNTRNTNTKKTNTHIDIVEYLNAKAGKRFKADTPQTVRLINARLKEGYTVEDFYKVIDNKVADWANDSKMNEYLRPQTLFGTKFEGYLNQKPKRNTMSELEEMYRKAVANGE